MQKTVTYLYPDVNKASSLKVFQDTSNQIMGIYFTRENIRDVEVLENCKNYSVYFLFDDSEEDESRVYVGQSINGIERVKNHIINKEFWSYCIMFVTDNNRFDRLIIDYLEYEFINKCKKSSYILSNKNLRYNEPNCSVFEKANIMSYIEQIEFLLSTAGIVLKENNSMDMNIKFYQAKGKYQGKLYVRDGKFILCAGSNIVRPIESTKDYKGNLYESVNSIINNYLKDEKVKEIEGKIYTTVDLSFKSPTRPAVLICGYSVNGWTFFDGLNELRGI